MNLPTVIVLALLIYNAYQSPILRALVNVTNPHPDLPILDAALGLVFKTLDMVGLGENLAHYSRNDFKSIQDYRKKGSALEARAEVILPKTWTECKSKLKCDVWEEHITLADRIIPVLFIKNKLYSGVRKPKRAVLYLHPGGGVVGSRERISAFMFPLHADVVVASVGYRLAPENPYPAGLEDAYAALTWLKDRSKDLVSLPEEFVIAGHSGGSLLAAAVAQRWKDERKLPQPYYLFLGVPMLGPVLSRSYQKYENIHTLPMRSMAFYWDAYTTNVYDCVVDVLCSPVSASVERLRGIAKHAMIVTAKADVLRAEGNEYARKLKAAGVETRLIEVAGTHTGHFIVDESTRASRYIEEILL